MHRPDHSRNPIASTDEDGKDFEVAAERYRIQRDLNSRQIEQLYALYQREWPKDARSVVDMQRAVEGSEVFVALEEISTGDIVAFGRVISDRGFRAWILGLIVRPDQRGQGLGRIMMDYLMQLPELQRVHSIGLCCEDEMIPFYAKWGFQLRETQRVMTCYPRGSSQIPTDRQSDPSKKT